MSDAMELYLLALSAYLQDEQDSKHPVLDVLADALANFSAVDIVNVHRDCLQKLTHGSSAGQVSDCWNRTSYDFLTEVMVRCQARISAVPASLLQLKNKYESVLQKLDSGIAIFNEEGCLTFLNLRMAQLLQVPRKALIGSQFVSIVSNRRVPRRLRKSMLHLYREMIEYRVPYNEIVTEQGKHLLVTATYGDDLSGDLLISAKDVTDYKRIEQAAYQNDKLAILGRISAGIAHEIRNPLTSIRGFIQFLKPDFTALGKEEYAAIILAEIDRANHIIYEFLNSSKPSAPIKQNIPVHMLLREVLLLFESEALMHSCRIEVEPIDPQLSVNVDVRQLKQVLLNIIKNAVEAVAHLHDCKGSITAAASRSDHSVRISISDNGNGMSAHTVSRLFDPFFTTKEEGTGLGLSVSYQIVKNHGGKIDVTSELGKGTTFFIWLPLS